MLKKLLLRFLFFCLISLNIFHANTNTHFCFFFIDLLEIIFIFVPGIILFIFKLLSSTIFLIKSSLIPKKFNKVVAFAGAP